MPKFSKRSQEKLNSCDIRLQLLFAHVVKDYDCTILEGHRSPQRQEELFNQRKSRLRFGKHNESPSLAVDVTPYPIPDKWGADDFKEKAKFYHFAGYVLGIAKMNKINIRWGGDWDMNNNFIQGFDDLVHFELID